MGTKSTTKSLCCVEGRYRRTIGKFVNEKGKIVAKKFLLGTDRNKAEIANLRLEQLWREVAQATHQDNQRRHDEWEQWQSFGVEYLPLNLPSDTPWPAWTEKASHRIEPDPPAPREPLWTAETLAIAEVIRNGGTDFVVSARIGQAGGQEDARSYAERINRLGQSFSGIRLLPEQPQLLAAGQAAYKQFADFYASQARQDAALANIAIPAGTGQTLYQTIDAYAEWVRSNKKKSGLLTEWGKVLGETVLRLKDSTKDMPLERLDYNAVERIKSYWAGRPLAKRSGKPISRETVRSHLKALRMFLKWLHKNPQFDWRKPDGIEDAWSCNLAGLMSDEETAALRHGVPTYTVEELKILYRYATDRERALFLLGLNCGFARAECVSLRIDEVYGEEAKIKRVRRKTRVYGEFSLWPETIKALQWLALERAPVEPENNSFVILSERGQPLKEDRIANQWNRLLNRVRSDHPKFRGLPFKFLRKTTGQLMRNIADGETMGVFLCHGRAVQSDELADKYSNRNFDKVFAALAKIHEQLRPMFDACPEAFAERRRRGGAKVSLTADKRIQSLHAAGCGADNIAHDVGVSRTTVYRRLAAQRVSSPAPA